MYKRSRMGAAVLAACSAGLTAPQWAFAQEAQRLERVEVTGSSIKRVDAETALPVTVVSRGDIERSGVRTTEELVAQLTTVTSAGGQVNAGVSGLATYGLSAVSMRGLGSQRTLVLVNGRRLAVFAGSGAAVNVNAIPLESIDRVEVLQDGASGVYGSDAIAGVMNFILRKDVEGVEVSATHGQPTRGGGAKNDKLSVVAGFGNYDRDRFSVTLSAGYEKEGNLLGASRAYANTDTKLPYYEGGATETGRIEGVWVFPGQFTDTSGPGPNARSTANPYGITGTGYGNPMAALGKCAEIGMIPRSGKGYTQGEPAPGGPEAARNGPNCTFDTGNFVSLVPNREYTGVSGHLRFKLNKDNELFAEGLASRNKSVNPIQPAPNRQAFYAGNTNFKGSGVDPAMLIYPQNPNYKIAETYLRSVGLDAMVGKPLAVSQRTFLIGPRTTSDVADQSRVILGARGLVGNIDYEVAYTHNRSKTAGSVINGFASIFGLTKVLNDPKSTWNPWAPLGKQPPEVEAALEKTKYVGPTIESTSTNHGIDLKFSGVAMELAGGPLSVAAGMNARDDRYELTPSAAMNSGDVIGMGSALVPVTGKRNVWAIFAEANAPISKELEGNLALRQDNYSDFGRTNNAKASLRWQPMTQVLVRGSAGTGFRAPTLVDLYQPRQIGSTEQFVDPANKGDGRIQPTGITSGNPNLKPEKSKQVSVGLVVQPMKSLTASVDYFRVKINDPIVAPSASVLVAAARRGDPFSKGRVTFAPDNTVDTVDQSILNTGSIDTDGIDIDLRWREKVASGRLDVAFNGTYIHKYDVISASGELEHSVGTTVRPDGNPLTAALTGVVLKWKHNLGFTYTQGAWSGTLTQRFYKGYEMSPDLNGKRLFVPNTATYDMVVAYNGIKNTKLSLGVRNLLDRDPPLFNHNGSQFQSGYDVYQEDPRGRFVYVTASYKF